MANFLKPSLPWLRTVRPASPRLLALFLVLNTALLFVFRTPTFHQYVSGPVESGTGGLIPHVLLANLIAAAVLIGGLIVGLGGLRWKDVGVPLGWRGAWQVLNAVLVTYTLWACAQLVLALHGWAVPGTLDYNPDWVGFTDEHRSTIADSMTAFFGSALVEEVKYRGFLLAQLFLLANHWVLSGSGRTAVRRRLWIAVVGSQFVFGLNHLPAGIDTGFTGWTLCLYIVQVGFVGVVFAILYLRTGNLFIVVGAHALINDPMPLYLSRLDPRFVSLTLVLALLLAWPMLKSVFHHVLAVDRLRALSRLHRKTQPK